MKSKQSEASIHRILPSTADEKMQHMHDETSLVGMACNVATWPGLLAAPRSNEMPWNVFGRATTHACAILRCQARCLQTAISWKSHPLPYTLPTRSRAGQLLPQERSLSVHHLQPTAHGLHQHSIT